VVVPSASSRKAIPWMSIRWSLIACFAACSVYGVWKVSQTVAMLDAVADGKFFSQAEEDDIRRQSEEWMRQHMESLIPSLDKLYPRVSQSTLDQVSGHWQIVEDWDDGLCWYSWGRTQREGKFELQVMDISEHLATTQIQHPWDLQPQYIQSLNTIIDDKGVKSTQLAICRELMVFDANGPGTFFSRQVSGSIDDPFHAEIGSFRETVERGYVGRGIAVPDTDRLFLFSTKETLEGQQLPSPEFVPIRPRCVGTHLTVLRRVPADFIYPPPGVDVASVEKRFRASTPRYLSDLGSEFDDDKDDAIGPLGHRDLIPMGIIQKFQNADEMSPNLRNLYEQSLKQFENP
jgi:hypothetical protein